MIHGLRRLVAACVAVMVVLGLSWTTAGASLDCAFKDVNDNGIFDPDVDIIVPDSAWIGTPLVSNDPFVVPRGCNILLTRAPAPLYGLRVIAPKITVLGSIQVLTSGGRGIVLIADPAKVPSPGLGDGSINVGDALGPVVKLFAGGADTFIATAFPSTPAVMSRSIALWAAGPCGFTNADIEGTDPARSTDIGINCGGDVTFRGTRVLGSRVNIQSILGQIDARPFPSAPPISLGGFCDNPATNQQNGASPPGNGNGMLDPGDFPCVLDFAALGATIGVQTFADVTSLMLFASGIHVDVQPNMFQAAAEMLVMIAQQNLDLRGAPGGLANTVVQAHTRALLVSAEGDVLARDVEGHPIGVTTSAKLDIAPRPVTVNRLPDDREDALGFGSGTLDIESACFTFPIIRVLCGAGVVGTPDPPPCAQRSKFGCFTPFVY